MKSKKVIFLVFALVLLTVPMYMMIASEGVLENGHFHKLKLRAYDPFDPFRGKYLNLNYDNSLKYDEGLEIGQTCYVTLAKDSLGFSRFDYAHATKPKGDDYIKTLIGWISDDACSIKTDNLSKYFINEDKAAKAEHIVQEYQREHPDDIYVGIRVLNGEVRLEDIYIEEIPILEYLEKQ